MTNTVEILKSIDERSLVLFDELGAGTDPQEGAALAIAILDAVGAKGSYVVATTHYPELKAYGYERPQTINASSAFRDEVMLLTFPNDLDLMMQLLRQQGSLRIRTVRI